MSAPKPGDRVRVTFEAVVEKVYDDLVRVCTQATTCGAFGGSVPIEAVEVLPSPVYVNHDTTEYRSGDVVRSGDGGDLSLWGYERTGSGVDDRDWLPIGFGDEWYARNQLPDRLILLVRDGQVITS